MTRALRCAAAVLAVVFAGCGGASGERAAPARRAAAAPLPPTPTPQPLAYVHGARAALAAGAIAVVDLSNRVAVEPPRMDVNSEQSLSRLRWSGWGRPRATATGSVRTLICDPDCLNGRLGQSRGELVLSVPKRCGGQRFYTRSSMTYEDPDTHRTRAPATYLRTPC